MSKFNMIRNIRSLRFLVPAMFIGLAFAFEGMMVLYWMFAVEPRLRAESEIVAKALAHFQSENIADAISPIKGEAELDTVVKNMEIAILLTNPATGTSFIKGIELEVDPDVIDFVGNGTFITRGNIVCEDCYLTEIPLYTRESRELLGIARFYMSMDFFRNLKNDMVGQFLAMSGLILIFIAAAGYLTAFLIRPLNVMADYLRQKDAQDLSATPDLTGLVTVEIRMVKTALDDLLIRTQAYTVQINQAYTELKNTQVQLVQTGKLASIGELAAGVAHELNQPLMVIRTASQILAKYIDRMSAEQIVEHVSILERNTSRMKNIINHLRIFSRQMPGQYEAVDINRVIEDAFLMIGEQLRLRNITIEKELGADIPACHGNPNQLEQVFLNLITNARDTIIEAAEKKRETHPGFRGRLEIVTRHPGERQDVVEILFMDNGMGVGQADQQKIFDPFFTTKEVGKGTGLGLSISYGIIRDHQGDIEVAETSDSGTTLKITLRTYAAA